MAFMLLEHHGMISGDIKNQVLYPHDTIPDFFMRSYRSFCF